MEYTLLDSLLSTYTHSIPTANPIIPTDVMWYQEDSAEELYALSFGRLIFVSA